MIMNENLRLFIALPIPLEIRKKLSALTMGLKKKGGNVKWVEESNFHLTLKFLGDTPEGKLDAVISAAQHATAPVSAIDVHFSGLGAFPNLRKPRVFWVGVSKGDEEIVKLAESLESELEKNGFARENRKFSAHLTIGRVRDPGKMGPLLDEASRLSAFEAGGFALSEIHLIKSQLTKSGPIYTTLKAFPLGKKQ